MGSAIVGVDVACEALGLALGLDEGLVEGLALADGDGLATDPLGASVTPRNAVPLGAVAMVVREEIEDDAADLAESVTCTRVFLAPSPSMP